MLDEHVEAKLQSLGLTIIVVDKENQIPQPKGENADQQSKTQVKTSDEDALPEQAARNRAGSWNKAGANDNKIGEEEHQSELTHLANLAKAVRTKKQAPASSQFIMAHARRLQHDNQGTLGSTPNSDMFKSRGSGGSKQFNEQ
eukprot:g80717.t1